MFRTKINLKNPRNACITLTNWVSRQHTLKGVFRTPEAVLQRCSVKKDVLKNFAKFTGKHLCLSLFLNKVAALIKLFPCQF